VTETLRRVRQRLLGHLWTIGPHLQKRFRPPQLDAGLPFDFQVNDPRRGPVPATGLLHHSSNPTNRLVVLIHGLASDPDADYVRTMAGVLLANGFDVMRLALRGSTGQGMDHYHGGQTDELHALGTHPELGGYENISVIGFSLGGHIALRFGTETVNPRIQSVVGICPPLCLRSCQAALDRPAFSPYRSNIIGSLKSIYAALRVNCESFGGSLEASEAAIHGVRSIHDWDRVTVVPRFGFESVEDYYSSVSVGPDLKDLRTRALIIFTRHDPMIPFTSMAPHLENAGSNAEIRVVDQGGHLGFPADLDLGLGEEYGLENQVNSWLNPTGD